MQSNNWTKFKLGFSLIETLIAIGAISFALPLIFAIFFVILQEQARFRALKQIKSEGEYVLYQIKNTIRSNAIRACTDINCLNECTTGDTTLYFQDNDGNIFRYFIDANRIASESVTLSTTNYLTSEQVIIEPVNGYLVRCNIQGTTPTFDINFRISYKTSTGEDRYSASMIYKSKVRLILQ